MSETAQPPAPTEPAVIILSTASKTSLLWLEHGRRCHARAAMLDKWLKNHEADKPNAKDVASLAAVAKTASELEKAAIEAVDTARERELAERRGDARKSPNAPTAGATQALLKNASKVLEKAAAAVGDAQEG